MNGTFIYLIGFAGSGKLTIAKAIQARYDSVLVDNHLVNNVIFSMIDPDGKTRLPKDVWVNVGRVRDAVFDTIRDLAKPSRSFIFTNELLEGEERDKQVFDQIAELAKSRGALFVPVRLMVSPEELASRVISPERVAQYKEIDAESALTKARRYQLLKPRNCAFLDIDVTRKTPEEAAGTILAWVNEIAAGLRT